jgi:hypothetical protein
MKRFHIGWILGACTTLFVASTRAPANWPADRCRRVNGYAAGSSVSPQLRLFALLRAVVTVSSGAESPPRVLRSVSYDLKGARRWALTAGISPISAA